jgi:uncharacterized coiled-coil DUF342 family protein
MVDQLKKQKAYEKVREVQKEILELKTQAEEIIEKLTKLMKDTGIGCSLNIDGLYIDYKPSEIDLLNFMFPNEFKKTKKYSEEFEKKVEKLLGVDSDELYNLAEEFDFQFMYETEGWTTSSWGC